MIADARVEACQQCAAKDSWLRRSVDESVRHLGAGSRIHWWRWSTMRTL